MSSLLFLFLLLLHTASLAQDPLAKCTSFPPTAAPQPSPPPSSFQDLLGGVDSVEDFFADTFERRHLHIRESARTDRRAWQHIYRRFVPLNDVDALLTRNASAMHPDKPLQLREDVQLLRPGLDANGIPTRHSIDTLFPAATDAARSAVDMPAVHQAFHDGFELLLRSMHHRSRAIAHLVDGLAAFWVVNVTASLHLAPPRPQKPAVKHAPQLFAGDVFLVHLDGEQRLHLFPGLFPYPAARHVHDPDVQAAVYDALREHTGPDSVMMKPGDVLYVPRGTGLDAIPTGPLSLHVAIEVATDTSTLDDGIRAALDAVREPMPDNPLYEPLEKDPARPGYNAAWIDMLHAAVRVAAEFTPQLRRFLPLGSSVSEVIEDAGGAPVAELVADQVRRFAAAAVDALFEPVIEVLADRGDAEERVRLVASDDTIQWVRRLVSEAVSGDEGREAMRRAETMFKACIKALAESSQAPFDGITSLQLEALERELVERPRRLKARNTALQRHGIGRSNETGDDMGEAIVDRGDESCPA